MFSFLAQTQNYFGLKGTCPIPPNPSTEINSNVTRGKHYRAMLHFNSEKPLEGIFEDQLYNEVMNCMTFTIGNPPVLPFSAQDCEFYDIGLAWTSPNDYNFKFTNIDRYSSCLNEKFEIEHVNLWMDKVRIF